MGERSTSMAWRVGVVAVTSAALGGLAAALLAIAAVDRLVSEQADLRLSAATLTLAGELDEDPPPQRRAEVRTTLDDENQEIVTSGIRLAVFVGGEPLAGDALTPQPEVGACATSRATRSRVRACASAYHDGWVLVAAQPIEDAWLHWWYVFAALGAIVLGGVVGMASSRGLSSWAVHPLRKIARALEAWPASSAVPPGLSEPSSCDEVEAVRLALLSLTSRLQALLEQAHRFAASAAHELRTPLTALRVELELLVEESAASERAALERIGARVARLSDLTERFLLLSLAGENLQQGFETLSLSDLVKEVVEELLPQERARLSADLENEGLVRGDAQLLRSLVRNPIVNALAFAPEGPIEIRVSERDGSIVFEVRDRGPGIPPELRERVVEPFHRGAGTSRAGHGLGLTLIGHIARLHRGRAEFATVEHGTHLTVTFPEWAPRATIDHND